MLSVVEDSPSTPIRVNPFRPTTDTDPELLSQMEEFIQLSASRLTSMFSKCLEDVLLHVHVFVFPLQINRIISLLSLRLYLTENAATWNCSI